MLVRASVISALLLALAADASAQESARNAASDSKTGQKPAENGLNRGPTLESLFNAPARKEEAQPAPAAPDLAPRVIRSTKDKVDESGLRYFAAQNNQKRVEKEVQRLKALYPDWTPPDDIFLGPSGGPEEQPFWDLFGKDKLPELRAAIAEKMRSTPKWKPSPALMYKIERKENRNKLVAAYEARQWGKVIETAAADPKLMTCSDIDVQWRVADAFAAISQKNETFEVYRYILANCRDKRERLVTLKKALAYFEPAQLDALIAMGARAADGTHEFDDIRIDIIRIRLGRAAAGAAERVADADIAFFEGQTRKSNASADASLLGWYRLAETKAEDARGWFAEALEWPIQKREDGSEMESRAKMAEGHILSLKALEKFEEAEAAALKWSDSSEAIRALYIDIVADALLRAKPDAIFDKDRLARVTLAISQAKSKFGAQALGWYSYNRSAWEDSIPWFRSSLDWKEAGEAPQPEAATKPAEVAQAPQPAAKAPDAKAGDGKKAAAKPAPAAAQAKAAEPTPAAAKTPKTDDAKTAEGLANALRNAARRDEAEELAYAWLGKSPALKTLYIDVFAESLAKQSAPLTFAPERIARYVPVVEGEKSLTGAQGLAWYHYNRQGWSEAVRWFRTAIGWTPDREGDEKLNEGYAQALRGDGQHDLAADIAYKWREKSSPLRVLFIDISSEQLAKMPITETLAKDRLDRLASVVTQEKSANGAAAIAWHLYQRKHYAEALHWFKTGIAYNPEAAALDKLREGYVLSIRYGGSAEQAEDLAYEWRTISKLMRETFFELVAESLARLKPPADYPEARMRRFVDLVREDKSSFGAQAIGWYLHQRGDNLRSAEWFSQSIDWGGPITDAKTAQGYLLALIALGRLEEADKLAAEWHEKSEEFRVLYIDTFGGAILQTTPPKSFPDAMLRRFEHITGAARSVFGSQAVAWYFYDRADWPNAARWFEASLTWTGSAEKDQKTVEGFAQSIRYLGRRDEAEEILYPWVERNPQLRKLYLELVAEGMVQSAPQLAMTDERIDRFAAIALKDRNTNAAQGLAWYRHDRRHWPDAVRWFKHAREWSDEAMADPKLAEGLAFALRNLDLYDESEEVSAPWKDRNAALRKLYLETAAELLSRLKAGFAYPNDRLERYLETVARDHHNMGAQAAGWYYHARELHEPASQWFWASLQWGQDKERDPRSAEGYVHSLRRLGRLAEAEAAAWAWIERDPTFEKLYIDIAAEVVSTLDKTETMENERLGRLATLTAKYKSIAGATGLAWYHQARDEAQPAAYWFERTIEWGGEVEDIRIVEGYILALVSLGRYDEAEALTARWRGRSDKVADLFINAFGAAILRVPKDALVPAERLSRYQILVGEEKSAWGAEALGWYFYERIAWQDSARWFETALNWTRNGSYDGKLVEAFSQSLRQLARRDEAEDHLYVWRDRIPLMRKLYKELVSEALVSTTEHIVLSDDRINRYGAVILEDRDFRAAQGLAWYRYNRRQWPDAVRWFKYAREWSPDGRGDQHMAEGLAFSLRSLDLYDESELVTAEWKDHAPNVRRLYLETVGEFLVRLKPEHAMPNDRLQQFLEATALDHNNVAAQAAGWYYYERGMFDAAADWFLASLSWGPDFERDPKTAAGYITALRRAGRLADAELAAYDLRDRSPALRQLYFEIAGEVIASLKPPADFPADRLARFMELTAEARSVQGAMSIAWYYQARENWAEATLWFERAVAWNGNIRDPKVAEGLVLAMIGLGRYAEAENLVHGWRGENPEVARLYIDGFGSTLLKLPADQALPEERISRFTVIAGLERSAFGAQSLAWYHYERKSWEDAARWFEATLKWSAPEVRDPKSIEGFAQSLRYSGRREEAEELLYQWRSHSPAFTKLYLEIVAEALAQQSPPVALPDARIDRFAQLVQSERSEIGAQSLGWYRYNRKAWGDAARWFKLARTWSSDGRGDAKLAEGLAFALRNMDLYDESEEVSWEWRDRAPAVRKLYLETVAEYIARLKERETYPNDRLSRYQIIVAADRSSIGAQAAGWYYHARQRYAEAATWFRNALDWGPDPLRDPKTAEGLIVALRQIGQFDAAETLAFEWAGRLPRFAELYVDAAADTLGRLGPQEAMAAERLSRLATFARNLKSVAAAQALGWYRAARNEWTDAAEWFKLALDWMGDAKDAKTIEGYALALLNLGRMDEAEALALAWKDKGETFTAMYADIVMSRLQKLAPTETYPAEKLATFAKLIHQLRHGAGAEAIGWYKLARNEAADSEAWFANAMNWAGASPSVKTIEGRSLALRRMQKFAEAEALAGEWRDKSESMGDIYRQTMIEQLVKTKPPAAVAADRIARFADHAQKAKSAPAAQALAWYAYDRKDWAIALQWFKLGVDWNGEPRDTKAAEGYALTLKSMGKLEEAETFAFDWREKSDEMRSLYIDFVPEMLAKLEAGKTFPAEKLSRFATQVTAAKSAYGAQALAWYRFQRNDHAQAVAWFRSALEWSGEAKDPKTAEGYALSLRATGQLDLAEQIAYDWRDRADALRLLYVEIFAEALTRTNPPPAFAPERLSRFAAMVSKDKSATGAQALGWYSYNIKQVPPARAWFEKAMQWSPSEGAALGLALSARAMKDRTGLAAIMNSYSGTYPKLMEVLQPQAGTGGTQTFATTQTGEPAYEVVEEMRTVRAPRSRPERRVPAAAATSTPHRSNAACIAEIEAKQRAGVATAQDMVAKGWCLLNADRPQEAAEAFERGRNARGDDPAFGRALSKLKSGETDVAAAIGENVTSQKKRNEIGVQVLAQRAAAAQRGGRYVEALHYLDQRAAFAPETRDLSMMRGWALWNLGRKDAARRIFSELDRQLSTSETQQALGVVNEVRGN